MQKHHPLVKLSCRQQQLVQASYWFGNKPSCYCSSSSNRFENNSFTNVHFTPSPYPTNATNILHFPLHWCRQVFRLPGCYSNSLLPSNLLPCVPFCTLSCNHSSSSSLDILPFSRFNASLCYRQLLLY